MNPEYPLMPMNPDRHNDFTKWRLNPEEIHERVKIFLEKKRFDPVEGKYVQMGKPLLNESGVDLILSLLNMTVNKDTILSNLTEDRIIDLLRYIHIALAEELTLNSEKYCLDINNAEYIQTVIMAYIEAALRRSQSGGERDSIDKMENIQRIYQPQEKKSRLGFFKGGEE